MKIFRAIIIGAFIWVGGVSVFMLAYALPVMKDVELQANIGLAIAIVPLVWFGARGYFLKPNLRTENTLKVGSIMLGTGIILDALITVPLLILPAGGSYVEFFITPGFWLLAVEYLLVVTICKKLMVNTNHEISYQ